MNTWLQTLLELVGKPRGDVRRARSSRPYGRRRLANERLESRVLLAADLLLSKTSSAGTVLPGEVLDYFITGDNIGDEAAVADFVDELPEGVTFISASASQGLLAESPGMVSGSLGTIEAGESVTIAITVTPQEGGVTLLNSASVFSDEDANLANNSDTISTTVLAAPEDAVDLVVFKRDFPNRVVPGEALHFSIIVHNRSRHDAAEDVLLFDRLPEDVILVSATSSQGEVSVSDGLIVADLGTLEAHQAATVHVVVTPTEPGRLVNTAIATTSSGIEQRGHGHSDGDSDGDSDADSDGDSDGDSDDHRGLSNVARSVTIVAGVPRTAADLAVVKSDDPDPVLPGEALEYTITVENLSAEHRARRVQLTDLLPAGAIFISATSSHGFVRESGGVVVAELGTLFPGEVATVSILVTPTAAGELLNSAVATTASGDINVFDNVGAETTEVLAAPATAADLLVVKGDSPDPVCRGEELVYTITVTNTSAINPAFDVVLTDVLPRGVELLELDSSQGTISEADGIVFAELGTLDPGATAIVEIVVLPGRHILLNRAVATTSSGDVNVLDNADQTLTR
ncbi:MAG: hypothetical protein WD403_14780, partial [Pirellulales bacterium]